MKSSIIALRTLSQNLLFLLIVIVARLGLAKVFRRRPEEAMKTLGQVYTSLSSILITFSNNKKLFILYIINTIYIK